MKAYKFRIFQFCCSDYMYVLANNEDEACAIASRHMGYPVDKTSIEAVFDTPSVITYVTYEE